jgi:hypothetical protein
MKDKLISVAFIAVLSVFALSIPLFPGRSVSDIENRELAPAPELSARAFASGEFADDAEAYLLDHFPLRDMWAGLAGVAEVASGRRDNGRVYFGDDAWLFSIDDIDFDLLGVNLGHIRDFVSDVSREYPGIAFSVLAAPASWDAAGDMLPASAPTDDEGRAMLAIREALGDVVLFCDPTEALKDAHSAGLPVYYRTDHHWTSRGAYIAYRVWAKSRGLTPLGEDDFDISTVSESFYGTNASKAALPQTASDRMEIFTPKNAPPLTMTVESGKDAEAPVVTDSLYRVEFLAERDKYAYFLGGNNPVVTIDTGYENGRTLLVLKDSFAHCFAPFLTTHFERVILVDPRYHRRGLERFFTENEITDVLFLYSAVQLSNDRNLFYLKLNDSAKTF